MGNGRIAMTTVERTKTGGIKESWSNTEIVTSANQKPTIQCQFAKPEYYTVQFSTDLRNAQFPVNVRENGNDISFVNGPNRILSVTTDFIGQGFKIGQLILISGSVSNNGPQRITGVAANQITLNPLGTVTPETTFVTANDISFATGPNRIISTITNFVTQGFANGQTINVTGSVSNDGQYTIVNVSANQITVNKTLIPEVAGAMVTIGYVVTLTYYIANNPLALITWSTEGNSISRVVSVLNGMSISGLGSHVKVQVQFARDPAGPVPVTIMVTRGVRPAQNQPPTYQLDPRSVPANGDFDILAYADSLTSTSQRLHVEGGAISVAVFPWANSPFNLADAEVSFVNTTTGAVIRSWNPLTNPEQFVPIPPGCDALRLFNHGGTNPLIYSVVVGIDG
jgi:hypothetical protein